jgi:2'-5' RNA ligase
MKRKKNHSHSIKIVREKRQGLNTLSFLFEFTPKNEEELKEICEGITTKQLKEIIIFKKKKWNLLKQTLEYV